ncbi:unnamed protein product [Brachionus calyciflorus]|uniref:Band 7 domain-containing protein n=1 Tax=Brachionus calyciflorus TaxID=104777 RepID=A0A813M595_9BILA|nr:unnamed protein product [Brachionus calyciflorus]
MSHFKIPIIKRINSSNTVDLETEKDSFLCMNSSKQNSNLNPSSASIRQNMHRPSVRSISETPNIIGAQAINSQNDICSYLLCALTWVPIIIFFPFSLVFIFQIVQEYERAVIFRLGRLWKSSCGPGVILVLPCIENVTKVDMRTVSFDVAPQEVLTKDSVTVAVDAVVYYRVFNPAVSVANVENAQESTRLLAQTSLRNVLGQKSLSEILSERESVSRSLKECLDEATDPWGIEVERVEFKDVRLPVQLQRAMAAEAEAAREARAKVIAAEGEQRAAKAIKGAADIISSSKTAIQLRYLQTLNSIASEKNSTIIFPVPIEIFDLFSNKPTSPRT